MLDRLAEFFVFGVVPLVVGMLAAPASFAGEQTLKGEVTYRERIALPSGAVVTIRLLDVSQADVPATVVAEQAITPTGQVPIPFELTFDPASILEAGSYALQARISVGDRVMFRNDMQHAFDPLTDAPQSILVRMAEHSADASVAITGRQWLLSFVEGRGAVDGSVTFVIDANGNVAGQGPCNRYLASAEVEGSKLRIGKAGATMMACDQELMVQERAFFDALEKVETFRSDDNGLVLSGSDGEELLRFKPAD